MGLWKRKPAVEARRGRVRGRVQSVAFRFYARQEAVQLRLVGWVRNLPSGEVEFQVQGPPDAVAEFLQWLEVGPPLARVAKVEGEPCELEDFDTFEIHWVESIRCESPVTAHLTGVRDAVECAP